MTNEERQTVIDALQASLGHLRKVEAEYMTADGQFAAEFAQLNDALAIMRREREPVAWMDGDGKVMSDAAKRQLKGLQPWNVEPYQTPLYKD